MLNYYDLGLLRVGLKSFVISIDYRDYMGSSLETWLLGDRFCTWTLIIWSVLWQNLSTMGGWHQRDQGYSRRQQKQRDRQKPHPSAAQPPIAMVLAPLPKASSTASKEPSWSLVKSVWSNGAYPSHQAINRRLDTHRGGQIKRWRVKALDRHPLDLG